MCCKSKKLQIIQGYFEEILPYVNYQQNHNDLFFKCNSKIVGANKIDIAHLSSFCEIDIKDEKRFEIDFSGASVRDVYNSLSYIDKTILRG